MCGFESEGRCLTSKERKTERVSETDENKPIFIGWLHLSWSFVSKNRYFVYKSVIEKRGRISINVNTTRT